MPRFLGAKSLLAATSLVVLGAQPGQSTAATNVCGTESLGYVVCLISPAGALVGDQPISATVTATTATASVARVEFAWNGQYLINKFRSPYNFVWPTNRLLDGTGTLSARIVAGNVNGDWVSTPATLSNGNLTAVPSSPADWATAFRPQPFVGEPVIAAVGSGAAGKPDEVKVINSIKAHHPAAFLYLGDVDEFGNWTTFYNHYGVSALDDPAGGGTLWGSLAGYTAPTPGNHEGGALYRPQWSDYWHQRPQWSTFTVGDIRLFNLSSNCGSVATCTSSPQMAWLRSQLAANTSPCVVSFWHIPNVSEDYARNKPTTAPMWSLLADSGGDLVINAHTHDMEATSPLNRDLQAGLPDSHMVELVSGGGAARWELQYAPDPRVEWELYKVAGAAYFTSIHNANGTESLKWWFEDTNKKKLRSGTVAC